MTLETAVLSGIIAFSASPTSAYPHAWLWVLHKSGLILLFTSVVLAGAVVFPQLCRREVARSWRNGLVYFGHLRLWQPATLADALTVRGSDVNLLTLSTQLVIMSRIAWTKHVLVQWSLLVALVGCIAVGIPLVVTT
ncbi:MAG: Pycsar system effector family protein [Pseudonocardiaceae bacterium]